MMLPFMVPFNLPALERWCDLYKPLSIDMTDKQYAWFAELMRANLKEFRGIPIHFVGAPAAVWSGLSWKCASALFWACRPSSA